MSSNEDSKLASSFISRSFPLSFLSYDSTGPHRVQFDSNNQLQDLSTNTHLICGCPDFQRVRQPSAPPAHCLCCFSLFLFSIISPDTHEMRQVQNNVQTELISLDAASYQVAHSRKRNSCALYLGGQFITTPCFPPSNISIFC